MDGRCTALGTRRMSVRNIFSIGLLGVLISTKVSAQLPCGFAGSSGAAGCVLYAWQDPSDQSWVFAPVVHFTNSLLPLELLPKDGIALKGLDELRRRLRQLGPGSRIDWYSTGYSNALTARLADGSTVGVSLWSPPRQLIEDIRHAAEVSEVSFSGPDEECIEADGQRARSPADRAPASKAYDLYAWPRHDGASYEPNPIWTFRLLPRKQTGTRSAQDVVTGGSPVNGAEALEKQIARLRRGSALVWRLDLLLQTQQGRIVPVCVQPPDEPLLRRVRRFALERGLDFAVYNPCCHWSEP